jgi:hypothetical protein
MLLLEGENRRWGYICQIENIQRFVDCIAKIAFLPTNHYLRLLIKLNEVSFSEYAQLKAKSSKILEQYPLFFEVLSEIKKIQCNTPCHEGPDSELGCRSDCEVRNCVKNKNYEGCWECSSYKACEKLVPLKEHHPGLEFNINIIKTYGPDNWSNYRYRGKHYDF